MIARRSRDLVWSVVEDHRTDAQVAADLSIEEMRDEPDQNERLRQDILALIQVYRERRRRRRNSVAEPCLECQVRWLETHDLNEEVIRAFYVDRYKRRLREGEKGGAM